MEVLLCGTGLTMYVCQAAERMSSRGEGAVSAWLRGTSRSGAYLRFMGRVSQRILYALLCFVYIRFSQYID
jgi:hypothetical protein